MSAEKLGEYFRHVWRDTEGRVYLPTKDENGSWRKTFFKWPEAAERIPNWVLERVAEGKEVYYSPAIWKESAVTEKSATKEHVKGSWVSWADFDGNAPESWESGAPGRPPESVPAPSWRLQSSETRNQHAYWLFDKFETDIEALENRNRAIALESKADTSGWDASQVLRPPYTMNYAYGKNRPQLPVRIEEETDRVYRPKDFPFIENFVPLQMEAIDPDSLPDIRETLAKHNWTKQFQDIFSRSYEQLTVREDGQKWVTDDLMYVAYTAAESGASDIEIYALVVDADNRWGKYVNRTDRHRRISDIVERARSKHPVGNAGLTFAGILGDSPTVEGTSKSVFNYREFLDYEIFVTWFLKGLIPLGGFGFVAGLPGVGKTQVCIRLIQSIASGRDFLMWENELGPQKVLFASLEMGHADLKEFISEMDKSLDDETRELLTDNFYVYPLGSAFPVDRPEGRQVLENLLKEFQPKLLLIDSLGKIAFGPIDKDEPARELLNYLTYIRQTYGCSIVIIHHNRKPTNERQRRKSVELSDLYGSQYFGSEASFVLMLGQHEDDKDLIEIHSAKIRFARPEDMFVIRRTEHLDFEILELPDELQHSASGGTGAKVRNLFGFE